MDGGVHFLHIPTPKDVFSVESFKSANDWSNTWLSGSSSALHTGAHHYSICANGQTERTQIVLESEVAYTLM